METRRRAFFMVPLVIGALVCLFGVLCYLIVAVAHIPGRLNLPLAARICGGGVLLAGFLMLAWVFKYRRPADVFISTYLTMQKAITGSLAKVGPARAEPFVVEGPQRHVRNPMYFAVVVMWLGWWLLLDYTFLLLLAGVFFLWFNLVVIPIEERELRTIFGDQFSAYAKSVPRFIPSLRLRRSCILGQELRVRSMILSPKEQEMVLFLARQYQAGNRNPFPIKGLAEQFQMTLQEAESASSLLDKHGYALLTLNEEVIPRDNIIQLARDVEAQRAKANEPPDLVEQFQAWARRKPFTAGIIIVLGILGWAVGVFGWILGILSFFHGQR